MDIVLHFFEGFWTWNTPVSFLAGVGVASICKRFMPVVKIEQDDDVQKK